MKAKRMIWLLFVAILSLAVVLSGCSNKSSNESNTETKSNTNENSKETQKQVQIEFWHTYSDTEEKIFNDEVLPLFESEHPEIKVKVTKMPYDGLKQQVIAGVAGNAAPDVMRMDLIWVPEFAKLGALAQLDDKDGFNELKGSVFEGSLATNYYNGKYYGLPLNTNTKVAIYNKTLLEKAGLNEPPKTFDELIQASEKLKSKDTFGLGISGTGSWGILPYFWTFGGAITNDDYTKATGYLNSDASVAALEKIVELNKKGLVAPTILGGEPGTWDGMKNNQYLMIDDGPWFFSLQGQEALDNTVVSVLPSDKGGSVSVVGGENVVMFSTTKHPEESWTFMKFLMSEKPQLLMAKAGLIPTVEAAAQKVDVENTPFIKPYIEQLKTAKPRTPHPNWAKIEESLNLAVEKVVRGEISAKKALDQAAQEIDGYLAE